MNFGMNGDQSQLSKQSRTGGFRNQWISLPIDTVNGQVAGQVDAVTIKEG